MDLPVYDVDLFSDEALLDPYSHYRAMRELGPFVWLPQHDITAAVHYDAVRDVLKNPEVFISGQGVSVNEMGNGRGAHSTLISDGELHRTLRSVVGRPITPPNIGELTATVRDMADGLVKGLVGSGDFDGVTDFAQVLPVDIVSHLVGIPEAGRERMLGWAKAKFNLMGAMNERARASIEVSNEVRPFILSLERSDLVPGSWSDQVFEAFDSGEVEEKYVDGLLLDYILPAVETTLYGLAHMLRLLGENGDQWELVKSAPETNVDRAVEEVLRYETVIRGVTRLPISDVEVGDVTIREGQRVFTIMASANRDEQRFDDAETFDISRPRNNHVGFGAGPHLCIGSHLARLEMRSVLAAMADHVDTIELGSSEVELHNIFRPFTELTARFD